MPRVADRIVDPPSDELLPKFVASLDPAWITKRLRRALIPPSQN
jgi:hypothetical protein